MDIFRRTFYKAIIGNSMNRHGCIMMADFNSKVAILLSSEGTVLWGDVPWEIFEEINSTDFWQLDYAEAGVEWYAVTQYLNGCGWIRRPGCSGLCYKRTKSRQLHSSD